MNVSIIRLMKGLVDCPRICAFGALLSSVDLCVLSLPAFEIYHSSSCYYICTLLRFHLHAPVLALSTYSQSNFGLGNFVCLQFAIFDLYLQKMYYTESV